MPKRTNDFQRLVYLVRHNLAEGATVTESKMMRDRMTKRFREVDVVIEGKVGSQAVAVCVECRDHKRVADVTWVDMMKAKHERLATNALLLASRKGFTPEARDVARSYGIETFAMDDVDAADVPALLGPNGSLWTKSVNVTAQKVTARVDAVGDLPVETVATNPDNLIHLEDGTELCQIQHLVEQMMKTDRVRDYLVAEANEEHAFLELVWEPPADHEGRPLHLKKLEPSVLRPIRAIRIWSQCKVAVAKFGLRSAKMGDVHLAWGKFVIDGRDAMAVATMTTTGEAKLSFHVSGALAPPIFTALQAGS
jgi:hypothetical protein